MLPYPDPVFKGVIGRTTEDSKPDFPQPVSAPEGAPNMLLILTDDVGFGASSVFGGPVPTPTFEALAANGLKYNEFNTTALCSPTRAALITGRDQHTVHTGIIMERSLGYPGYDSLMPKSAGTVAEILRGNGYSTAWFGKNHNVPAWQSSAVGPFDLWPTGLGFDYFYGFIGGDVNQWDPTLFENTTPIEPKEKLTGEAKANYHLDADLADQAIHWIEQQHALAPNKPFFAYYAPGATHAPASRAEGLDRQVQGPVRPGLGQAARGDVRAPEEARRDPAGYDPDAAAGQHARLGLARCEAEGALCPYGGDLRRLSRL